MLLSVRDARGALIASVPSPVKTIVTPFRRYDREAFLRYVRAEPLAYYPRQRPARDTAPLDPRLTPQAHHLLTALRQWRERTLPFPEPHRHQLSAEEIEQLESLGYI